MKIKKIENTKATQVFIRLDFMGADADVFITEEYNLECTFQEIESKISYLKEKCSFYERLRGLNVDYGDSHKDWVVKYGQEIADELDIFPSDPTCGNQTACTLDDFSIIAYDEFCNLYKVTV